MKIISFSLTTNQIKDRAKTVTRRLGWRNLKVGERLQACEKCMGRRHGEPLVKLAVIEVTNVRRERLDRLKTELFYGIEEVQREGFTYPFHKEKWGAAFVQMFCREMKCEPSTEVTRIEFKYPVV